MNISFADFWDGFDHTNNFFVDLLKSINPNYNFIPFSDQTEILIYSCFGRSHHKANRNKVKKIFYTGENLRPNYNECDYSLTFDFDTYNGRNIRLPLWMLQIDWFNKINYNNPQFVIPPSELKTSRFSVRPKTKFCSIVFNNPTSTRIEIIDKLSKYKKVDCYGNKTANIGYGEDKKYEIVADYKFNICFENTLSPGYYTEKLLHAKVAGCLPLYWADKECKQDFNTLSFLNLNDYSNIDNFINHIIELDQCEKQYTNIVSQYLFENKEPSLNSLKDKIQKII
jgi:alpha(1,3/1,4) fucosyltransferase